MGLDDRPKLRIFAGPNGSGKSTLFNKLIESYSLGIFLNADEIEKTLISKGYIDVDGFNLTLEDEALDNFYKSEIAQSLIVKAKAKGVEIDVELKKNVIYNLRRSSNSYEGAFVSAFLRRECIKQKKNFCFETVMSHLSKLEELKEAQKNGFKIYLYFVCIDDPSINVSRVENRVAKGGHDVDPDDILNRYNRTLGFLKDAVKISEKSYLIDNSNDMILVATVISNDLEILVEKEFVPNWLVDNLL